MKTFKSVLFVLFGIIVLLVVGYFIYTWSRV